MIRLPIPVRAVLLAAVLALGSLAAPAPALAVNPSGGGVRKATVPGPALALMASYVSLAVGYWFYRRRR